MTAASLAGLVAGLVLLVGGAELLVRGAAAFATRLGISPVIVGLTVVAFGTSAPEMAVSVGAASTGDGAVALGNVVGSNIGNVMLILGAAALVGGLSVSQRIVRLDVPLLVAVSVVVFVVALDGTIGTLEGSVLALGIVAYTAWVVRAALVERREIVVEYDEAITVREHGLAFRPVWMQVGFAVGGLAILVVGARVLVGSATDIATAVGVSDLVVGLTIVAIGTSLPELATSVLAAVRGQRDLAVGNVVGSNLFNLLGVLGVSALAAGGVAVDDVSVRIDLPVMVATTVLLLPLLRSGFRVTRLEGVGLLALYLGYLVHLVVRS